MQHTQRPSTLLNEDTPRPRRRERAHKLAALALASAVAVFGITEASKGHSGPAHNAKTEADIARVIKPKMEEFAGKAVQQAAKPNSTIVVLNPTKGITEIRGTNDNSTEHVDVVMRNFPGTLKPNPQDVLAVDVRDNYSDDKVVSAHEGVLTAPGGGEYLSDTLAYGNYPTDKAGWNALQITTHGHGNSADIYTSGALDTAGGGEYYADGAGPVGTAETIVHNFHDFPTV